MTASNNYFWRYEEPLVYNYNMTRTAAFIGNEAIVVATDGRVCDRNRKPLSDDQRKIYPLSPICVIMPSGGVAPNIDDILNALSTSISLTKEYRVSYIAYHFQDVFNASNAKWLEDITLSFLIAGYDYEDSVYSPKLIALFKVNGNWKLHEPKSNERFMVGGNLFEMTHAELRKKDIPVENHELNKFAIKSIKDSMELAPDVIGGEIGLWNIYPSIGKGLKRFMPPEIKALQKEI